MDLDDQLLHYLIAGGAILLSHTVKACYDWVGQRLWGKVVSIRTRNFWNGRSSATRSEATPAVSNLSNVPWTVPDTIRANFIRGHPETCSIAAWAVRPIQHQPVFQSIQSKTGSARLSFSEEAKAGLVLQPRLRA